MKHQPNWEPYISEENGLKGWINRDTGEFQNGETLFVREGSVVLSPEEVELRKRYGEEMRAWMGALEERLETGKQRYLWRSKHKHYVFVSTEADFSVLSPAAVARLFFLGTFMGYEGGALRKTERTPMRRKELPEMLGVSATVAYGFWKEVEGRFLLEDTQGRLSIPAHIIKRGPFKLGDGDYQCMYVEAMQALYRATPARKHKHLGYVLQMTSQINRESNILCGDIWERELEKVCPVTVDEFCRRIGYSRANRLRLIREYSDLTFPVENRKEQFCAFAPFGPGVEDLLICINPHLIYRGDHAGQPRSIGDFGCVHSFCEKSASKQNEKSAS